MVSFAKKLAPNITSFRIPQIYRFGFITTIFDVIVNELKNKSMEDDNLLTTSRTCRLACAFVGKKILKLYDSINIYNNMRRYKNSPSKCIHFYETTNKKKKI